MRPYAMYGGSFDPIHCGHLSLIRQAQTLGYEVIVVPAYRHAFGKQSAPFAHRLQMCLLGLQAWQLQTHARVCSIEQRLAQASDTPVYTYEVLCALRAQGKTPLRLIVGPDIAAEWTRWYHHADIDREFGRVALPMTVAVRSTDIRQHLRAGGSAKLPEDWLPEPVTTYIATHDLYR
ncbi:MAG: nicotinate-nicotinamide nucleotide adenylyltransferase [Candidatus Tectimicrobiota bacterium]